MKSEEIAEGEPDKLGMQKVAIVCRAFYYTLSGCKSVKRL